MLRFGLLIAALSLAVAPNMVAQAPDEALLDGWHVVRPGETLWDLAERYLGSEEAWPELHALNRNIDNPHRISPGQRVRVQVRPQHAADVAQIASISRKVEEQLTPLPWLPSTELNMLNPRDGVRTYESSSSELLFPDATRLTISEDTLVFLGRSGTVRREVRRDEIEIVLGQADLQKEQESDVREVVLGDGRMTPAPEARLQARLRRPESGGAQVMVYAGDTVVESGGASQSVTAGMGTQMAEGMAPSAPEQLLPAPEAGAPAADSDWPAGGPAFTWGAVEGAASYVFEVCRDSECAGLVRRRTALETTETSAADLEAGSYHWRVTAVSGSGLDGFPSTTRPFTVRAEADAESPTITAAFVGTQIEREGALFLGSDARLEIEIDDASGVERAWAVLDGAEVELAGVEAGWSPGAHEVVIHARDRVGNEGRSETLAFTFDPLPPEIHWGPESGGLYHSFRGESNSWTEGEPGRRAPELVWSTDRKTWRATERQSRSIQRSVAPRFFLRSGGGRGRVVVLPNVSLPVKRRHGVGVLANDQLVGTKTLDFRVVDDADGTRGSGRHRRLVVEATDHLGNRSSVSWLIRRGGAKRR